MKLQRHEVLSNWFSEFWTEERLAFLNQYDRPALEAEAIKFDQLQKDWEQFKLIKTIIDPELMSND